jgi:hypothetical protein
MASKKAIESILTSISANYGKRQKWITDVNLTWLSGLKGYSDRDVMTATKRWINNEDRPPTVANIRNTIKGLIGDDNATPAGCSRCDGTGCVEIAHHTAGKKGQPTSVKNLIAGCDCGAGQRLRSGSYAPWDVVVDRLRRDPYTLFVFHSDTDRPVLKTAERFAPETLERIAPSLTDPTRKDEWRQIGHGRRIPGGDE